MRMLKGALAVTALIGGPAASMAAAEAQRASGAVQSRPTPTEEETVTPAVAGARTYNLSRAERAALQPVLAAITARDWAAATAAMPVAEAAARGADAKYVIGQMRVQIGIGTNDRAVQSRAVDEMIASGGALPGELPALYENQLSFALAAGDAAKAARAQAQLDALNPNDPNRFIRQARARASANDAAGAIALYQQAIQATQAANQPIPVEWRQQIAGLAYQARLPQTVGYMRDWLAVAPAPALWHDSLAIYAELATADNGLKLDIYRLMRAAGALTSERDYIQLGEAAYAVRAFAEVKAVLEEGLARNVIGTNAGFARQRLSVVNPRVAEDRTSLPAERTAALAGSDGGRALSVGDAFFGNRDYGPAAELYRAALQKGGQDAGLVNTRLGAALALAGQRAEAETAFRAVTGPRAELAQFWLLWLSTRS